MTSTGLNLTEKKKLSHARADQRAVKTRIIKYLYDVNFVFTSYVLRRETSSTVSRSRTKKRYFKNEKPLLIYICLILKLRWEPHLPQQMPSRKVRLAIERTMRIVLSTKRKLVANNKARAKKTVLEIIFCGKLLSKVMSSLMLNNRDGFAFELKLVNVLA